MTDVRLDDPQPRRKPTLCRRCHYPITWENQRVQFGRAMKRYGLTRDAAKVRMPLCGKCLTSTMRGRPCCDA
jgi:hypothetical protein